MNLFPESRRWSCAAVSAVLLLGAAGCSSSDDAVVRAYAATVSGVTEAANAFLATLDADEKKQVLLEFKQDSATAWSNLPCGSTCRPGIKFADLDAEELAAAKSVLKTALGTRAGTGFDRVEKILLADDHLGGLQSSGGAGMTGSGGSGGAPDGGPPSGMGIPAPGPAGGMPAGGTPGGMPAGGTPGGMPGRDTPGDRPGGGTSGGMPGGMSSVGAMGGGSGYSSGTYFLAFLGTPSTDGTWQLHFGGHHLAVNLTYKAGAVVGATPFFVGVEPTSWTVADGSTYAPLDDMRTAMLAVTSSLSAAERAQAKLTQTYTDVLAGPGKDGQFPATKQGLAVGTLSAKQKGLVLAAIKPWVVNADGATAAALMSTYESELDKTYVSWSGTTALTRHADYVRIDGPSVWVEFVCQDGIVIRNKIHYHTVYRDHTRDYGGEFTFS